MASLGGQGSVSSRVTGFWASIAAPMARATVMAETVDSHSVYMVL